MCNNLFSRGLKNVQRIICTQTYVFIVVCFSASVLDNNNISGFRNKGVQNHQLEFRNNNSQCNNIVIFAIVMTPDNVDVSCNVIPDYNILYRGV